MATVIGFSAGMGGLEVRPSGTLILTTLRVTLWPFGLVVVSSLSFQNLSSLAYSGIFWLTKVRGWTSLKGVIQLGLGNAKSASARTSSVFGVEPFLSAWAYSTLTAVTPNKSTTRLPESSAFSLQHIIIPLKINIGHPLIVGCQVPPTPVGGTLSRRVSIRVRSADQEK